MNRKAFTLIELLVVVAIIGILAAVGVVAYNGYTTAAKKAVVKQNFRTTVSYMKSEFARCGIDSSERIFGDPGVPCADIFVKTKKESIISSCFIIDIYSNLKLVIFNLYLFYV